MANLYKKPVDFWKQMFYNKYNLKDVKILNEENNIISINKEVDVIEYDIDNIKSLIYTIRGKQVMLDSDVAMLYHYETKRINETVRRNKDRFPINFCFQLTEDDNNPRVKPVDFHMGL